uniref:Uncharacterized protein n=1 Tax=Xenopus tropicalis TaxID=8364 RepID=A0A1B8Y7Y7_XENTR
MEKCLNPAMLPIIAYNGNSLVQITKVTLQLRIKRDTNAPKGSFDNSVYIDSIGVPCGVPDEFKARNQITAGFKSLFAWWTGLTMEWSRIAVSTAVLVTCGCCRIPCIRGLLQCLIDTALTETMYVHFTLTLMIVQMFVKQVFEV